MNSSQKHTLERLTILLHMMDGWNLLQFKTKIGKKARQKCMVPRVVPKTPKYPLYLKIIAEKSMPRVKPTNAKMSSIPILQY